MNFKLKYENLDGEIKTADVTASSLDEAVEKTKDIKNLIYHMASVDSSTPDSESTVLEWITYTLPEPHLSRFIHNVKNGRKGPEFLEQKASRILDTDYLENQNKEFVRRRIIDTGFTWGNSKESDKYGHDGSHYWKALHDGRFEIADSYNSKWNKSLFSSLDE